MAGRRTIPGRGKTWDIERGSGGGSLAWKNTPGLGREYIPMGTGLQNFSPTSGVDRFRRMAGGGGTTGHQAYRRYR